VAELPAGPADPTSIRFSHPNPFRAGQRITFTNLVPLKLRIVVLDGFGRKIAELASGEFGAGSHSVTWDGHNRDGALVAPGMYFVHAMGLKRSSGAMVFLH